MKVLVLSMTVGQGHNSTSKALRAALLKKGHQCDILDTYKFLNKAIGLGFDKGYVAMGRFVPKLNETIYKGAETVSYTHLDVYKRQGLPRVRRMLPGRQGMLFRR